MYKIIKNEKLLSEWLGSEENTLREVLLQKRVKTHLYTAVGILDEVYGSDRDIKKDLGGYVIIFYGEQKEAERQFKSCLKEYYLKEDDFEFVYMKVVQAENVLFSACIYVPRIILCLL